MWRRVVCDSTEITYIWHCLHTSKTNFSNKWQSFKKTIKITRKFSRGLKILPEASKISMVKNEYIEFKFFRCKLFFITFIICSRRHSSTVHERISKKNNYWLRNWGSSLGTYSTYRRDLLCTFRAFDLQ